MKRVVFLILTVFVFIFGFSVFGFAKAPERVDVESKANGSDKDVEEDTIKGIPHIIERNDIFFFISSDDHIIMELERDFAPEAGPGTVISANGKYALFSEIDTSKMKREETTGLVPYKVSLYNVKGKKLWEREYEVYFEYYCSTHSKEISANGEYILLFYVEDPKDRDPGTGFNAHIVVLDTLGKEVVHKSIEGGFSKFKISPDGKLVGANTSKWIKGKSIRHLFFLDVETGIIKIVKSEGKVNGEKWSAGADVLEGKRIMFFGGWHSSSRAQTAKLHFDSIPEDLSKLDWR